MNLISFYLAIFCIAFFFIASLSILVVITKGFQSEEKPTNLKENNLDGFDKIIVGISILFGIIGALFFIHAFSINDIKHHELGDYIGGVVGSLWAASATLLFILALKFQREDLKMTKNEMKNQTQEFERQRLLNLIFKQVDRINNSINSIEFSFPNMLGGRYYKGFLAIKFINQNAKNDIANNVTGINLDRVNSFSGHMTNGNWHSHFFYFLEEFNSSAKLIQQIIEKSELLPEDKDKMYDIILNSISEEVIDLIPNLNKATSWINNIEPPMNQVQVNIHHVYFLSKRISELLPIFYDSFSEDGMTLTPIIE